MVVITTCVSGWQLEIALSGLIREDGNQRWDSQPQKALYEKEKEPPEAESFDPGLKAHQSLQLSHGVVSRKSIPKKQRPNVIVESTFCTKV